MRTRVILAIDKSLDPALRAELRENLEDLGWVPIGDNDDMWKCGSRTDDMSEIERRIRKVIEFAAFTAGVEGDFGFAVKLGTQPTRSFHISLRETERNTRRVVAKRQSGLEFSTEKIPSVGPMPSNTEHPGGTQLKTAF